MLRSNRWMIVYQWSAKADEFVDLTRLVDGNVQIMVKRNAIGTCTFRLKYRSILELIRAQGITLVDFLNEWLSTVSVYMDDSLVFGGVLDAFPQIQTSSLDADITLTFQSWLGLMAGMEVMPPQSLTGPLDQILVTKVQQAVEASAVAAMPYPVSIGTHIEQLAAVTWTVDNVMTLKDFLVQRTDNSTGAGPFDINFTPDGQFEVWQHYGVDTSDSITYTAGDDKANVESVDYPAWDGYNTDVIMSGAGNGYGVEGSTITAHASSADSRRRHMYHAAIAQDSSISTQDVLNRAATQQLKYAESPAAIPEITINATRLGLKVCEHGLGGDLWLGDTISMIMTGIYAGMPSPDDHKLRVNQLDITLEPTNNVTVKISTCSVSGGAVNVRGN
ncbi:MAG: hypothetical protein [Bacteriophage sp.]|nr:MAG: hypothetical protein [Bacteriophage sp.]